MNNSLWRRIKRSCKIHMSRKRGQRIIITSLLLTSIGLLSCRQYEINTRGLSVVYGEKNIGVVRDKSEVIEVVSALEKDLSKKHNKNIKIDKEISFVETHAKDSKISKKNDIKKAISEDLSYSAVAYAIKIDEKEVAYLDTQEKAKEALREYKESFVEQIEEDTSQVKEVGVIEDVSLIKKKIPVEKINDIDSTISKIKTGDLEEKKHIIKGEENFWTLAEDYGIAMEDIEQVNIDKDTTKLKDGDEVVIPVTKPLLTVATSEEKTIQEEIDFEVEYEIDENLEKDKEEVRVEGEKGAIEKEIKIERHNGVEVGEEVISESIVKEPIKKVIAKGTKPLAISTGIFSTPTRGEISSPFGHRWGKLHAGLDIAARVGEPIEAADGGVVSRSEFNSGGYGYMVDVDHGNGYVTRYAHCSQLYVKNGDKVAKGDMIAAVGNTGRSTGPHLHFEVRKNGSPVNPQEYLK